MKGTPLAVILLLISVTIPDKTAEAVMYRCLSRAGNVLYTNVPTTARCEALSFSPSSRPNRSASFQNKTSRSYDSWIRSTAARYGIDYALIKAIIHIESGFDHRAVSSKGARGLMQLMPTTARELRVQNSFDPRQNIDGGTRYFRKMLDTFNGNLSLSLAAYNAGPGVVQRVGHVPPIPETREYVRKVLKMYERYKKE